MTKLSAQETRYLPLPFLNRLNPLTPANADRAEQAEQAEQAVLPNQDNLLLNVGTAEQSSIVARIHSWLDKGLKQIQQVILRREEGLPSAVGFQHLKRTGGVVIAQRNTPEEALAIQALVNDQAAHAFAQQLNVTSRQQDSIVARIHSWWGKVFEFIQGLASALGLKPLKRKVSEALLAHSEQGAIDNCAAVAFVNTLLNKPETLATFLNRIQYDSKTQTYSIHVKNAMNPKAGLQALTLTAEEVLGLSQRLHSYRIDERHRLLMGFVNAVLLKSNYAIENNIPDFNDTNIPAVHTLPLTDMKRLLYYVTYDLNLFTPEGSYQHELRLCNFPPIKRTFTEFLARKHGKNSTLEHLPIQVTLDFNTTSVEKLRQQIQQALKVPAAVSSLSLHGNAPPQGLGLETNHAYTMVILEGETLILVDPHNGSKQVHVSLQALQDYLNLDANNNLHIIHYPLTPPENTTQH